MQTLPPLNAIRAFEAAARNRSFSRAAKELHVTQGAISHHIKTLEDSLSCQLFLRHPQGVELTDAGEQLLPDLTSSFERITQAIRQVHRGQVVISNSITSKSRPEYLEGAGEKADDEEQEV